MEWGRENLSTPPPPLALIFPRTEKLKEQNTIHFSGDYTKKVFEDWTDRPTRMLGEDHAIFAIDSLLPDVWKSAK